MPEGVNLDEVTRIVVEPASDPDTSDDYSEHEHSSKVTAQQQIGKFPKLVAAFPNYENPQKSMVRDGMVLLLIFLDLL